MGRTADFQLSSAIAVAGFTPSRRDLPALIDLVAGGDDATVQHATRALTRLPGEVAVAGLTAAAAAEPDEGRAVRVVTALGAVARSHPGADGAAALIALLGDAARPSRARRAAAVALGKIGGDAARAALLAHWDAPDLAPDHRRAVAEALGKVGGAEALARLRALDPGADAELARRRDRASLMIERDAARGDDSAVDLDAAPPFPLPMIARCRTGLEGLLADELRAQGLAVGAVRGGAVAVTVDRPLAALWRARTLMTAGLTVPLAAGDLALAVAAALSDDRTFAILRALTRGPIRWRLDFAGGGHRRAVVWRAAQAARARQPALVNDPTATTWDAVVVDDDHLELRPRRFTDPRFGWRVRDVPAASHPTLAAALARTAGVRSDDVVWDPFVGSGAELVERGLLGPFQRLIGTDLDPRALDAARANLEAAGFLERAELAIADATRHRPAGVTLIISNPPLGRRLRGDAPALLEHFLGHAAGVLVPGGRLVWVTPVPARTARAARAAGLVAGAGITVDLGGFDGRLETWTRPR
jgi:23S rRNA G2445 N2-methylase RlmL